MTLSVDNCLRLRVENNQPITMNEWHQHEQQSCGPIENNMNDACDFADHGCQNSTA